MKHILYHPIYGFMETDYDEMRERKLNEGVWVDYQDIADKLQEVEIAPVKKRKRRSHELENQ